MLNIKSILLVTLSMVATAEVLAEREWPEKVFDCQVETSSGAQGLVSIQSLSLDDAEKGVEGLTAITLLGNEESAVRSMQCIEQRSGKSFTDSNFDAWVAGFDQ